MFTPLHNALGFPDGTVDFDLVQAAVEAKLEERSDLDWKRNRPAQVFGTQDPDEVQMEFAKDAAAMANSGGGMIVYGVEEEGQTSAAKELRDLGEVKDSDRRGWSQILAARVYPPILGVEFLTITSADQSTHLLAMIVPDSPDRPHLVTPCQRRPKSEQKSTPEN